MARIQIADLAQVQTEFNELSDLELEAIIGGVNPQLFPLAVAFIQALYTRLSPAYRLTVKALILQFMS